MTILEIEGVGKVEVGDDFKSMPDDLKGAFVDSIIAETKSGKKSSLGGSLQPDTRDLKTIRAEYLQAMAAGDQKAAKSHAEAFVRKENIESPSPITDRVRQFAKGVPVIGGALDELNAATASIMPGGPSYSEALDYQRAKDRVFEQANPIQSTGLQLGGGLVSGLGAAAKIAPALGNMSRAAILGTGVGGGAALGGADAFTRGEGGVGPRLQDAVVGAGIGGAVGGLAPVVAKGVSSALSSGFDALTTNRDLRALGLSRQSGDILQRALSGDSTLGGRGAQNIASAGPRGMLADAGQNAAGVLDATIQRGGTGAARATEAVQGRAALANDDVADALNRTLGRPRGLLGMEDDIRRNSAVPRTATYESAYATPINYASREGMALEQMLARVPGAQINEANRLMQLGGERSRQIMARIADDGTVTYQTLPDVRQLDYITRALNQASQSGEGAGALGGQTTLGAAYQGLSRDIRTALRNTVPEYDLALRTAAQPIREREALQFGRDVLSSRTTREEVQRFVAGTSGPERQAVAAGVRSQIDDAIANVQRVASDPNLDAREATKALRDLSTRSAREKIEDIVGSASAGRLFSQLDEAMRSMELRAATASNSKTYARMAVNDGVKEQTAPGALGLLMQGSPILAAKRGVQGLLGTTPEASLFRQDRIYNELAGALTGPRGRAAERYVTDLAEAYRRKGRGDALARNAGLLAAGGGAGLSYPAIYQRSRQDR